jgi:hypothetical protein
MGEPLFHDLDPWHGCVELDRVLVFVEHQPPGAEVVESVERRILARGRATQGPLGYIHVIDPRVERFAPDEGGRRAFIHLGQAISEVVTAGLIVIERGGFVGAALRAIATTVLFAARVRFPHRIARTLGEGVPWLRTAVQPAPTVEELEGALAELKRRTAAAVRR